MLVLKYLITLRARNIHNSIAIQTELLIPLCKVLLRSYLALAYCVESKSNN